MSKHQLISKIIEAAEELERIRPPFETTAAVIAALGGQAAVAQLTGSAPSAVANWNSEPHFPARFYAVMLEALHKKGFHAGPRLWGMAEARQPSPEAA